MTGKWVSLADLSPAEARELVERTAFGRVLAELMEARGLEPTPDGVMELAAKAGVHEWKVLNRTFSLEHRWAGNFKRLADHMELTPEERRCLRRALEHEEE